VRAVRRVTFSRNYTLSLSRTCRCYCKYCAFATHRAHLYAPGEVEARLDEAVRRRAKELLVLTGERPEVNPEVARRLREFGHADFVSYVVWTCERALERGLLPHTNLGVLDRDGLARLREVTASQGLMLESISERLMETVHAGSPTKHPARRLETIAAAGELRIPFTSGILVGIGESVEERIASLEALAAVHERHGHLQEVILQNFVPHPRYYGREVAELADEAAKERWSNGGANGADPHPDMPDWATEITLDDMKLLVRECRRLMPDVGIQIPPNLSDWWVDLVEEGATDLGGLSANGDHISPEQAFPSPHQVRKGLAPRGYALSERLCAYAQYLDPDWMEQGVLDVVKLKYWSFIPRKGSGRSTGRPIDPDEAPRAIEKGRRGEALTESELTALLTSRTSASSAARSAASDRGSGRRTPTT
jgi:FO synthase